MRFRTAAPAALVLLLAARAWCAPAAAPDFALKDAAGKTVRLSALRGQTVLLDFFATWCDSCQEALPFYRTLSQRASSGTLTMLGIDEGDRAKTVAAFAKKNGVTYPVLLDADREAYDAYRVRGLPTAVLIGADGTILDRWSGFDVAVSSSIERAVRATPARPR